MLCSQQDEKKQRPQYSNNSSNLMLEEAKTNHFLHLTIQHKTTASPKTIFIQANATKAGAPIQDLEFGTFLKKAPQRQNLGLWD